MNNLLSIKSSSRLIHGNALRRTDETDGRRITRMPFDSWNHQRQFQNDKAEEEIQNDDGLFFIDAIDPIHDQKSRGLT